MSEQHLSLRVAHVADAPAMLAVIRAAFDARPPVDPPADYLFDTLESLQRAIGSQAGVIAELGDGASAPEVVGCLLLSVDDSRATLARVSVLPEHRRLGIAEAMVRGASELATDLGASTVQLLARHEFPETRGWWERHGFRAVRDEGPGVILERRLPTRVEVPTAADMQAIGARLAAVLQAGDVVIATGDLGAGKTTFTQGLGAGLGVSSPVISPTFVLSRVHRSLTGGPSLVHVDAYRLSSAAELEDIDLDESLADSITLIEWGAGLAEGLSASWLDIDIRRSNDPEDETRVVYLVGTGERWLGVDLSAQLSQASTAKASDQGAAPHNAAKEQ